MVYSTEYYMYLCEPHCHIWHALALWLSAYHSHVAIHMTWWPLEYEQWVTVEWMEIKYLSACLHSSPLHHVHVHVHRMVPVHCMWPVKRATLRWWTLCWRMEQTPTWPPRYAHYSGVFTVLSRAVLTALAHS